jgi:hypothetical protein
LFALLARRLSDEEVATVTAELLRRGDIRSETALREAILAVTRELPREEDVARVEDRLAAVGWPGKLFDRAGSKQPGPAGDQGQHNPGPAA